MHVDGADQSQIGGAFLWLRKARVTLHELMFGPDRDVWEASHDGYRRLRDAVEHMRARSGLGQGRIGRLRGIGRELRAGRYRRYSRGWRSAWRDLLA